MSPTVLRRFRAERLLRRDFEGLRAPVLAGVRRRLALSGTRLDTSDLEECYAQAWQGLFATLVSGQEVLNPTGWLIQVTFRRAIEEARAAPVPGGSAGWPAVATRDADPAEWLPSRDPDPAQRLDDHARLRQVFEALRLRLGGRECEAASLCYLQGLSRAEAAARMGLSEARMRKLMDGGGPGRPGVAAKVGELLGTIRAGRWCDEQASLMRGLAFGLLEPGGARHRLAVAHQRECPACRAYVASLRGLAATLPPLSLPVGAGAAGAAGAGVAAGGGAAAGGGWLLAGGSLSAKLAVGCVVALSVGAGCVALSVAPARPAPPRLHTRGRARERPAPAVAAARAPVPALPASRATTLALARATVAPAAPGAAAPRRAVRAAPASGTAARREFGPEGAAPPATSPIATTAPAPVAVQASAAHPPPAGAPPSAHTRKEFGFE